MVLEKRDPDRRRSSSSGPRTSKVHAGGVEAAANADSAGRSWLRKTFAKRPTADGAKTGTRKSSGRVFKPFGSSTSENLVSGMMASDLPGATPAVNFLAQFAEGALEAEEMEKVWEVYDPDHTGTASRERIKSFLSDVRVMHSLVDRQERYNKGQIPFKEFSDMGETERVGVVPDALLDFTMRQLAKSADAPSVQQDSFVKFFSGRPLIIGVDGAGKKNEILQNVVMQTTIGSEMVEKETSVLFIESDRRFWVDSFRNLLIIYNLMRVPYSCAFDSDDTLFTATDFIVDLFFWAHFFLSAVTLPSGTRVDADELLNQAREFLSTRECYYQIVCGFPIDFVLFLVGSPYYQFWRIPRMLRAQDLRRSFARWELNLHINFVKVQIAKFVITLAVIAHVEGCVWYGLARSQGFGLNTWYGVAQAAGRIRSLEGRTNFAKYLRSLSSAGFAILEAGYAEVSPANNYELAFAIVVGLLNMVLSSYLLGNIAALVTSSRVKVATYREQMKDVSEFCRHQNLPTALRDSLLHFKQAVYIEGLNDYEVMAEYPANMQLEVARFSHLNVLTSTTLFTGCDHTFLDAILIELKPMVLLRGQYLIRRGTSAKEMYFLARGEVKFIEARFGLSQFVDQQAAPAVVGDISFLFGTRANLDVVTVTDCHLLVLTQAAFGAITASHHSQTEILRTNCLELYRSRISPTAMKEMEETIERINQEKLMQLCEAAGSGDLKTVKFVSDNGLDLGVSDYDRRTALHIACSENTVAIAEFLLQKGAPYNPIDRWGNNPLHDATIAGHDQCCKLLTDSGARLLPTAEHTMQVCAAAAAGQVDTVARYIRNGISPDTHNYDRNTLLHLAAMHGRGKVIQMLLKVGASVNELDNEGTTPLYHAVMNSHVKSAKLLAKGGGVFVARNVAGVLCDAASDGGEGLIRRLHDVGVDVNAGDYDQRTALHLSASTGRLKVVQVLIACGAQVNIRDRFGGTPMMDAMRNKHVSVAEYLFTVGGEFDRDFVSNALCDAASQDDIDEVRRLVEFGANVDTGDYDARTALHLACSDGRLKVVQFLVEAGANVNVRDRFGGTPLQDAIKNKHFSIVTLLRANGAEIGDGDLSGLLCATAFEGDVQRLEVLVQSGANCNAGDYDSRTALHLACSAGRYEAVVYLIDAGADINAKDRWGGTPLSDAVAHKHTELVALLTEHGATMEQDQIASRLCDAASQGDKDDVQRVLDAGADVNSADYDGRTALHLAASSGHQNVVQLLVTAGGNVNVTDRWGSTPLSDAMRGGFKSIEALLISSGATPPKRKGQRKQRLAMRAQTNNKRANRGTDRGAIGAISEEGDEEGSESGSDVMSVTGMSETDIMTGGGKHRRVSSVSSTQESHTSSMSSHTILPHRRVTVFFNWDRSAPPMRLLVPPKGSGTMWDFFKMAEDKMGVEAAVGPNGLPAPATANATAIARVFTRYGVELLELSAVTQDDVLVVSRGEQFQFFPVLFEDPRKPWQTGSRAEADEASVMRAARESATSMHSDFSDDGSECDNLWAPQSRRSSGGADDISRRSSAMSTGSN